MKKLALLGLVLMSTLFGLVVSTTPVQAANAADFDPGYIIDDHVFYDSNAMSASQIQTFLESKVPNCDYNGTQPATEWGYPQLTRAQFAYWKSTGAAGTIDTGFHAPPYKCLTMYTQNTPQMEAASGLCGGLSARTNATAAQIINDVAKACSINPQVLIVLLEKEQSLVTDVWPLNRQLNNATGFACPDTAPCDPAFGGFFYQVYYAARQFKIYKAEHENPALYGQTSGYDYNYRAGRDNIIKWNPNSACGTSTVYIRNQATAGLYIYTPYRPNQAALNNLYGSGDGCSSYGNRNFWRIFTDWFGSTKIGVVSLDDPRWMEVATPTQKTSLITNSTFGVTLEPGHQIYFPSKFYLNDQWYLRSRYDHGLGEKNGIRLSHLKEIPVTAIEPKVMTTKTDTHKVDPLREKTFEAVPSMAMVRVVDTISVDGQLYYRTTYEHDLNRPRFVPASALEEFKFHSFLEPRFLYASKDVSKINVLTGESAGIIPAGSYIFFNKRITIDGQLYAQAEADNGTNVAVKISDLKEFSGRIEYVRLTTPRWMKLAKNTYKRTLLAEQNTGPELLAGREIYFPDKLNINGVWYLRTQYDRDNGNPFGIPLDELKELWQP